MKYTIIFLLILLIPLTTAAFGFSFPYSKDNPLELNPGQSQETSFTIKNSGEEPVTIQAQIIQGAEITQLIDESTTYTIPPKQETKANIKITIPENTEQEEYTVAILFKSKPSAQNEGMIQFATNIGKKFTVKVTEKQTTQTQESPITETQEEQKETLKKSPISKTNLAIILITLALIASLIIVTIIHLSKKQKAKILETPELQDFRKRYQQQTRA